MQLREKQKARRYYGVLERPVPPLLREGLAPGRASPARTCSRCSSRRLDNVLVRLGFAASRRQARQLIRHGHWTINGRRVDIPSYQVREGDVIAVKVGHAAPSRSSATPPSSPPRSRRGCRPTTTSLTAKVLRKPERREIAAPVQEQLIVELYSK